MVYKVDDITRDVKVALDLNNTSEQLVETGDIDTLTLDELIESKIADGVRLAEMSAPVYLLEQGHNFGDDIFWGELESGWTPLPDDFMRLVSFRMSDWDRTVYTAISTADKEYMKQSSRYKGVRGNPQRPVCAIAVRPEGRVLEFYSCLSTDAEVTEGVYLPEPTIDSYGGIDISEKCYRGAVYAIAAITAKACGSTEKGKILSELSKTMLQ